MIKLWNKEEMEFLKNNYKNLHYKEIGSILDRSYKSVSRKAEELGLFKKVNKSWTEEDLLFLKENYSIMPPIKIAKHLNRSYNSICSMAQLSNVYTGYKYHTPVYNELFVDNWSRELAYFVGLILSDGYVSNSNFGYFVRLGMCDRDVIEKTMNITEHKGNIAELHKTNGYKTSYTINFYGKKIWDFFTKLGFDNNKSYLVKFPEEVPTEFIPHLIRGVFDGDGSLALGNKKYPFARICGTKSVVESVAFNIGLHCTFHQNTDDNYTIQYTGDRAVKFLDYLYKDSTNDTRMNRKYNKYLGLINDWR